MTEYNRAGTTGPSPIVSITTLAEAGSPTPPTLVYPPFGVTVEAGTNANFTVLASGSPAPTYQWRRNGVNLPAATGANLTLPGVVPADSGAVIDVVVTNSAGSVTSGPAVLNVVTISILVQPTNLAVEAGGSAQFSVVAAGAPPLRYQWRRQGANLAGETNSSLLVKGVTHADSGTNYDVVVSNDFGSVMSSPATLAVPNSVPVSITVQPSGLSLAPGGGGQISVTAAGSGPLHYQWRRNGANLAGENVSVLALSNVALSDSGASFDVIVSNGFSSVTSSAVTLVVAQGAAARGQIYFGTMSGGGQVAVYLRTNTEA